MLTISSAAQKNKLLSVLGFTGVLLLCTCCGHDDAFSSASNLSDLSNTSGVTAPVIPPAHATGGVTTPPSGSNSDKECCHKGKAGHDEKSKRHSGDEDCE